MYRFADELAKLRYYSCRSQAQFAADLGVPLSSYIEWEHGSHLPCYANFQKILMQYMYTDSSKRLRKAYTSEKLKHRRSARRG